jgi:hypothetical protein
MPSFNPTIYGACSHSWKKVRFRPGDFSGHAEKVFPHGDIAADSRTRRRRTPLA